MGLLIVLDEKAEDRGDDIGIFDAGDDAQFAAALGAGLDVEAGEIELDENGCFELILSSRPHDGDWLPMTPETGTLIVRQTFLDRQSETPAELRIERSHCADDGKRPSPLTPHGIDEGLKAAGGLVAGASLLFAKWARDFQRHSNRLPLFDPEVSNAAGGDPNIVYYHSHWALAGDEALLIEVTPRRANIGTSS